MVANGQKKARFTMNDDTRDKLKGVLHVAAAQGAEKAGEKARASSGWKRWLWAAGAALAAAVAWFTSLPF